MRILALDLGDVRCGLAATDASGTLASPLCVLPLDELLSMSRRFRRVLEDVEPELLLVGRPLSLAGEVDKQAQHLAELAQKIAQSCGLPLEFIDERLSSAEAKRILRSRGYSERKMRGKVDMIAASLFLETWLRSHTEPAQI